MDSSGKRKFSEIIILRMIYNNSIRIFKREKNIIHPREVTHVFK